MRCGYGVWTDSKQKIRYEGQFRDHKKHGHGVLLWSCGSRLECEFRDGHAFGAGTLTYDDGSVYVGEIGTHCLPQGQGVRDSPDGSRYEGEFRQGNRWGKGKMTHADGTCQEGYFENDEFIGDQEPTKE
jgi:hypothetical protein